jgi:NADPH:quinone reductase-like Zn-dependent oxidoreductase
VIDRNVDIIATLGNEAVDVVIDLVAGPGWSALLKVLKRGGRYITAGAIAGPMVELDVRTLYLKDLSLFGSTFQDDVIFPNLISYIEAGEIRPILAATYPLADIARAQEDFLAKKHTGKLVLLPPSTEI